MECKNRKSGELSFEGKPVIKWQDIPCGECRVCRDHKRERLETELMLASEKVRRLRDEIVAFDATGVKG